MGNCVFGKCWTVVFWMFSILDIVQADHSILQTAWKVLTLSAAASLILFFSDICQWNTSVQWPPFFIHIHISPPSVHHNPPDGCDIVYVPATREEQKVGEPRTAARVRTSFRSEWIPSIHSVKWIRIRVRRRMHVCLSVTPPAIWLPFPTPSETEAPDRGRGSCLRLNPWRIWL